jgi:hypothetical protein
MSPEESAPPPSLAAPASAKPFDWGMRPRRAEGVELSEVTDGYLVYQPSRDRVHYLNPTAALLLEICDGSLTAEQLPPFLVAAFQLPAPPKAEVEGCLAQLLAEELMVAGE